MWVSLVLMLHCEEMNCNRNLEGREPKPHSKLLTVGLVIGIRATLNHEPNVAYAFLAAWR